MWNQAVKKLRQIYPQAKLETLCLLFGVKRGAYYEYNYREKKVYMIHEVVIQLVKEIREEQPRAGTPQLYRTLKPDLVKYNIKIGRDALNNLLADNGMLIKRKTRKPRTTNSEHGYRRYPNLIKDWQPLAAEELWVTDITYLQLEEGIAYLFLLTDGYSHKVMGWHISENMEGENAITVLKMAIENRSFPNRKTIHHSDQGSQYSYGEYVKLLKANGMKISMAARGKSYENPVAERLNGIVKVDLGCDKIYSDIISARESFARIIQVYNSKRLHSSVDYLTPEQAHNQTGELKKHWKNRRKKKNNTTIGL